LQALAANCQALIVRNRTQVRGEFLAACKKLQVVGRLGVGLDNIDLETCQARGIEVYPATGANEVSVAEYVVGGILVLLRRGFFASEGVLEGRWPRQEFLGFEACGRQLGLIGYGGIARQVARRAEALGMRILAHDPYIDARMTFWENQPADPVDLTTLLQTSDVVSLHVPLNPETRHLIDRDRLATVGTETYLINTARGGIVDEAALAQALREGRLAGALIDVFEDEPVPADCLWHGVPNLILTPHIAEVTHESSRRISEVTVQNVLTALERCKKDESLGSL
jgi:(S)-sulfolactate dehydrogenase